VKTAGAGQDQNEAEAPAILKTPENIRILVFSLGASSSGIPRSWAARRDRPGVNYIDELSPSTIARVAQSIGPWKRKSDVVVASIHWGGNWGYEVSRAEREFAHRLIDQAQVDVVHGHSSHHVKGIEVYRQRLILYGCGDFLTDYEGIHGHEEFRGDLGLMCFASIDPSTGKLAGLQMTPTQMHRMQIRRAAAADARWLADVLNREGEIFNTRVEMNVVGRLTLWWKEADIT
jgi:poly-gamma-glutamate synthesis protein (capsule biosynthesis protein)